MLKYVKWQLAALPILAVLVPAVEAEASEPPSAKVARWHDKFCPRDLTPTVTSPLYGYYPTRWRLMPSEIQIDELPPPVPPKAGAIPRIRTSSPRVADSGPYLSPYGLPNELKNLRRESQVRIER